VNTSPASQELLAKYALEGASQIHADTDRIRELGVEPISGDYLDETEIARHATDRAAQDLLELAITGRNRGSPTLSSRFSS
jgi:hypothetical protein